MENVCEGPKATLLLLLLLLLRMKRSGAFDRIAINLSYHLEGFKALAFVTFE